MKNVWRDGVRRLLHPERGRESFVLYTVLLSLILYLFLFCILAVMPITGESIFRHDLFHQYAPFLEELRSRLIEGRSLQFSFETGLGKSLLPQIAYYTASPLNLLALLFPATWITPVMTGFIVAKLALAAGSFAYFLRWMSGKNHWAVMPFGLLYACSGFLSAYYWNVMWLDGTALFPLVALGVERLLREGRSGLYLTALALSIFCNFYLGFII